jgi:hypothetical protein
LNCAKAIASRLSPGLLELLVHPEQKENRVFPVEMVFPAAMASLDPQATSLSFQYSI